jgi:ArsR family transcriptional regulator
LRESQANGDAVKKLVNSPPIDSFAHLAKIQNIVSEISVVKRSKKSQNLSFQQKSEIFKALGHPTRLQIVEKLADGELCVCHILEMFDVDVSTLSRHLSVLKNAKIVIDERRGKNIFYRLRCFCILDTIECMDKALIE